MTTVYLSCNRIDDVIVSVLASIAVDCGFEPRWCQTKDCLIVICCFKEKKQTSCLGIRIMCPSGATYLSADLFQ